MRKFPALLMTVFMLFPLSGAKAQHPTNPPANFQEQNTMSVLWFQKSGEAKALYYQGYNIGKMRLDEILRNKAMMTAQKPAIVLDLDETVLDNSPYQAWNVLTENKPLPWEPWFERSQGKALPGAVDFLKYADSKGVAIFYISNRKEPQKAATIKNLQSVGAPQADAAHVLLMKPGEKGKETRRSQVAKNYNIVLLFGDNLGDFSGFDNLSVTERLQTVEQHKDEFGRKLIVFPNPMYGDWEDALYQYDNQKSSEEKARIREENLQPFQP